MDALAKGRPNKFGLEWVYFAIAWAVVAANIAGMEHFLLPDGPAIPWFFAFCMALVRIEQLKKNPDAPMLTTLQKLPLVIVISMLAVITALMVYIKFFYVSPIK